jgi:hypothetical protein
MGRVSIDDDVICRLDVIDDLTSVILICQSLFGNLAICIRLTLMEATSFAEPL